MSHLGTQISALADGQLPPAAAERALAHVAGCAECAADLAAARAARQAVAAAFDVPVDPALTARLLALGAAVPPPEERSRPGRSLRRARPAGSLPDASLPMPGSDRPGRMPPGCLRGDLTPSRTPRVALAVTAVAAVASVLAVLGTQPVVAPTAHPAHALTLLSRAGTTSATGPVVTASLSDLGTGEPTAPEVLAWMADHGWAAPEDLPDGYEVSDVRVDDDRSDLELDLTGPDGTIVVTEQRGRLDVDAVAGAPEATVGGRTVRVLSEAPWHAVWQSGDAVVSVVALSPGRAVEELVAAYPEREYDPGVPARLVRGWSQVTAAFRP